MSAPALAPAGPDVGLGRYTPEAPLALLTDYPPDVAGGGAVILRSLLGPEERRRVLWLTPSPPAGGAAEADSDDGAAGPTVHLRAGSAGRGRRRSLGLDQTVYARALAEEALATARGRGARALWVVMHGAAVAMAARIARRGALPIHATVHDDPAFANALRSRKYLALVPLISRDFDATLRRAASVDVIGAAMGAYYRRRLGVESVVVHRALPGPVAPVPDYDPARQGLRVGVLGSTYAYEQLPILGRAVEQAAGRLGVPGRLLIVGRSYGDRLRAELGGRVEVEVTGHVEEAEGVARLRDCFALYLNYPFGRRDAVLRRTSFPTKLSTYVQAARPLLIHAPADSSVLPLVGPDGYAHHWGSPGAAGGADLLARLWAAPGAFAGRHEAAERVRARYYDPARNRRALFEALAALAPASGP